MESKFHTWGLEIEGNGLGPRIQVASDASLDEGAIIRTIAESSILSSGVEYFLGLELQQAENLRLALNNLRDGGYVMDPINDPGPILDRLIDHMKGPQPDALQERWFVDDLQACDLDGLPQGVEGVQWEVEVEHDDTSAHAARLRIEGPTKDSVIAFVREHWGDDDEEWFDTFIVDRVQMI